MPIAIWFLIVAGVGVYLTRPLFDPDLWWHLAIGKWILSHQSFPSVDYWNAFGAGKPWLAYSWSHEILYAYAERIAGLHGLLLLQTALAIFVVFAVFWSFGKLSRDWFFGSLIGLIVSGSFVDHFSLRPQSFVWALFALAGKVALDIRKGGITKTSACLLVGIFCLWANAHITTALGIVGVAVLSWNRNAPERTLWAVLYAFLGTLLTPYFGAEWIIFFTKTSHPFVHSTVIEFLPATVNQVPVSVLFCLIGLLLAFVWYEPKKISPTLLMAGGIFAFGGLLVVKFLPFAAISVGLILAETWGMRGEKKFGGIEEGIHRLSLLASRFVGTGLAVLLIALSWIHLAEMWDNPVLPGWTPEKAVDLIVDQHLPRPIMNAFGEGGYLMYRLSNMNGELLEENRVTIDGRTNVAPLEVFIPESLAYQGKIPWKNYLEIVQPKTILWKNKSPLSAILSATSNWCCVFRDGTPEDGYSVFVERDFSINNGMHCIE